MRKLPLTIILLVLTIPTAVAQVNIKGRILEAGTQIAIPYVNIGVEGQKFGTVSDGKGYFSLDLPSTEFTLTFSAIGFDSKNLPAIDLQNNRFIELTAKAYAMPSVEISAQRMGEERIFGVKNKTRGRSVGYGSRQLGAEIGAVIPIEGPTYIKSAHFMLNHAQGDNLLFRVNLYDFKDGRVGENLLLENVLIQTQQERGELKVDLTSLNLVIERPVLLSLEWIKDDKGAGNVGITFDTKKIAKLNGVYTKHTSQAPWELMLYIPAKTKLCFYLIGREL